MSNYITQTSTNFTLKKENSFAAYEALQNFLKNDLKSKPPIFHPSVANMILDNKNLYDMMYAFGFALGCHKVESTEWTDIEFLEESWEPNVYLEPLRVIAPYVEDGSFLEFNDEEGRLFRVAFYNGTAQVIRPQVVWPMPQSL